MMSGYKKIKPNQGFKKGQSGNPKGRPKIEVDNRGVKKITVDDLRRMITRYFNMTFKEMTERAQDPTATTLELTIASCLNKAIITGDFSKVTIMLERVIGRVKDAEEMDEDEAAKEKLREIPTSEIRAYLRAKIADPEIIEAED